MSTLDDRENALIELLAFHIADRFGLEIKTAEALFTPTIVRALGCGW